MRSLSAVVSVIRDRESLHLLEHDLRIETVILVIIPHVARSRSPGKGLPSHRRAGTDRGAYQNVSF
jgi:hypothetical protein